MRAKRKYAKRRKRPPVPRLGIVGQGRAERAVKWRMMRADKTLDTG